MRSLQDAFAVFSLRSFNWDLLGFGLCRAWISIVFLLPVPAEPALDVDSKLWFFLPGAAACLALCLVSRFTPSTRLRTCTLLTAGTLSAAGATLVLAGIDAGAHAMLGVGLVCVGTGAGLMQTLWGDKMAELSSADIDLYTICAMLLAAALSVLARIADAGIVGPLGFALFPFGSFVLLCRGFAAGAWRMPGGGPDQNAKSAAMDPPHLGRLCLSIFMFVFVFNFANTTLPPLLFVEGTQSVRNLANLGVTLMLLTVLLLRGRIDRMGLYRLSFPVLLGALLLMLVVPADHASAASFTAAAGYKLFDVLFWCVLVGLAHEHRARSWRILGLGMAANLAGMGLGIGLHAPMASAIGEGTVDPTLIVCAAMFALAVVTMLILPERLVAQILPRSAKRRASEEPTLEQRCDATAESAGLTARERDVLALLAQGRTQGVIARKLGISEGTVHTHIIHVYQKTGVHSQQELIDAVEASDPS